MMAAALVLAASLVGAFQSDQPQLLQMQHAINVYRAANALAPVEITPHLLKASDARAIEMSDTCAFAHDDIGARIWGAGYPSVSLGEVLLANDEVAPRALMWLLESPPHKAIIDNPEWRGVGISIVAYRQPCEYVSVWVVDFGESDER